MPGIRGWFVLVFAAVCAWGVAGCSSSGASGEEDKKIPPQDVPLTDAVELRADSELTTPGEVADTVDEDGVIGATYNFKVEEGAPDCGLRFSGMAQLEVKAWHNPEEQFKGEKGIKKVELFFVAEKDKKVTEATSQVDGKYVLDVDLEDSVFENLLPKLDGKWVDGPLPFKLKVTSKSKVGGELVTEVFPLELTLDATGPALTVNSFVLTQTCLKVQGSIPVALKALDPGKVQSLNVFVGETELLALEPVPLLISKTLDLTEIPSGLADLRIVARDCLGNETVVTQPLCVVATPAFILPLMLDAPEEFGNLTRLVRPLDGDSDGLDMDGDGDDWDDDAASEVDWNGDKMNDIVAVGPGGILWAHGNGNGTFDPLALLWTGQAVLDAWILDVTGDGVRDIVALCEGTEGRNVTVLHWEIKKEEGKEDQQVLAPAEVVPIPTIVTLLRVADMNRDGFPDLLVGSPEQTLAAAVFLHTGRTEPSLEELEEAGGEDAVSQDLGGDLGEVVPQPPTFFAAAVPLPGPYGVTDIALGHFNGDKYPDAIFGRGEEEMLSCAENDTTGLLDIAINKPVFGKGTELLAVGELISSAVPSDDLVVSSTAQKALYVLQGTGNGCVTALGPGTPDVHEFGTVHVANMVQPGFLEDGVTPEEGGRVLVVGGKPDSIALRDFNGDGTVDIAAASPETNQVAVFVAADAGSGRFREGLFIMPGREPRSLVAGHFDKGVPRDPIGIYADLACIVDPGNRIAVLLNEGLPPVEGAGGKLVPMYPRFAAPMDVPMPVGYLWTSGRLVPTHFAVADMTEGDPDGTGADTGGDDLDLVVATMPEKQLLNAPGEQVKEKTLPLILSYLSAAYPMAAPFPSPPAIKSAPAHAFDQQLVGFEVGHFDNEEYPDIAITVGKTAKDICTGRNFDILRGGWNADKVVTDEEKLGGYHTDFYAWDGTAKNSPGHFAPLGGFLGLKGPTGMAVAQLDGDPKDLDDIVLLASESGASDDPDYQPDTVAAYLTRFGKEWLNPGACTATDQPFFLCAPYWPLEQTKIKCEGEAPAGEGEPEGEGEPVEDPKVCEPVGGLEACDSTEEVIKGSTVVADILGVGESGKQPVAAVVADFDGDKFGEPGHKCLDMLVANKDTGDVTYLRAQCDFLIDQQTEMAGGVYGFHQKGKEAVLFGVGMEPRDVKAGDLDDDGWLDGVVALADSVVLLYGIDGEAFELAALPTPADLVMTPSSIEVADLNDDDLPDIVVTSEAQDELLAFINGGERDFLGPYTLPTGRNPLRVRVADLDADGCDDVAVLNSGSRSVTILRNRRCTFGNEAK